MIMNVKKLNFTLAILVAAVLLAPALHAASITWDAGGGADKNWSTVSNWSDNATATGDDVTFDATGALASGTTSIVDTSISIASLTYNLESSTLKQTTSIAAGQTLTVAGNFLLAPSINASATAKTDVIINGATGALIVNGTSFQVGQTANSALSQPSHSLDMSGLGTLTANLGSSGIFRMNSSATTTTGPSNTVVKLAANSTITANVIGVGDTTGKGATYTLKLGSTANTLNANTISIGQTGTGRSSGELSFETGTGTLKLRAADGTSAVTAMNLINSGLTGTATFISTANFAGHDVDAKITTLTMGRRTGAGAQASANATFTFDTGILEVGTLNLGEIANATYNSGAINATMNIGGGNATFGSINMATSTGAVGSTVNSSLNFTGGTTTVNGNITKGGGNGTTATLNLNGAAAILDMTSGNLTGLDTITYTDGLLKNLSVVNTGMTLAGTGSRVFDQATGVSGEIQGAITGSGVGLTKQGAGSLTLSGANSYTGATTINAGTLQIGSGGSTGTLSTSSALNNNGTLVFNRNNAITQGTDFASVIAGNGNVIQNGSGELILSGANTYTGTTTISAGTLTVSGTGQLGSGSYAGAITNSGVFNYASTANQTLSGIISGSGAVTKSGTGTLTLSGANNYNGTTTINAGTLNVTDRTTMTGFFTLTNAAGATLDFTGISGSKTIGGLNGGGLNGGNVVNAGGLYFGSASSASYGGIISGAGFITQNGTGTQTLSGNNTYTGQTAIQKGTLSINSISSVNGGASSLGNAADAAKGRIDIGSTTTTGTLLYTGSGHTTDRVVNLLGTTGGATLDASGSGALVFSSAFTATGVGAKTLTLTGTNTADNRIGGAIVNSSSGATSLTKSGTGKWVLSGANTYTGGTTVSAGTLLVDTGASVVASASTVNGGLLRVNGAAGSVTVNGGGSLGGSGTVGALTLNSGGLLNPGNSPGTLTAASAIVLGGSTYNWQISALEGTAGTNWDLLSVTGLLNMTGVTSSNRWNLVITGDGFTGWTGTGEYSYVFAQAASVSGFIATAGTDVTSLFNINTSGITGLPNSSYNSSGDFKVVVGRGAGDLTTLKLMAIPEPSTGSMLGFGLGGLVLTRVLRRRRNS
jgi:autotransporter-associated beta strand protein